MMILSDVSSLHLSFILHQHKKRCRKNHKNFTASSSKPVKLFYRNGCALGIIPKLNLEYNE
jgi:hypothetical protein